MVGIADGRANGVQSREFSASEAADSCAPVASVEAKAEELPLVAPSASSCPKERPHGNHIAAHKLNRCVLVQGPAWHDAEFLSKWLLAAAQAVRGMSWASLSGLVTVHERLPASSSSSARMTMPAVARSSRQASSVTPAGRAMPVVVTRAGPNGPIMRCIAGA
jgi:hypothetical protein